MDLSSLPPILIFIRHAATDREGFLTKEGLESVTHLVGNLRSLGVIFSSTEIISSHVIRALKTGQVIAKTGNITGRGTVYETLFSSEIYCDAPGALRDIGEYCKTRKPQALIVIMHLEIMSIVPHDVCTMLGIPSNLKGYAFSNCEGVLIQTEKRTVRLLSRCTEE